MIALYLNDPPNPRALFPLLRPWADVAEISSLIVKLEILLAKLIWHAEEILSLFKDFPRFRDELVTVQEEELSAGIYSKRFKCQF